MNETDIKGINECNDMVIYDHWSYMATPGILEVMFIALREEIKIDMIVMVDGHHLLPSAQSQFS